MSTREANLTVESLSTKANPQQLEAILATDGPVLIIAGPGHET